MQKRNVLVVFYSQTGQLARLTEKFIEPLKQEENINLEIMSLKPIPEFGFPWKFIEFFNIFPETVHLRPRRIERLDFQRERYDLIIIAYTVWFLSPSQPITAFLLNRRTKNIIKDTPVVTLIGCRNMWLMAQEQMKMLLSRANAKLIGNVAKIDQCSSGTSFITTPLWMLTGKKKPVSWLSSAGISDEEINDVSRFGKRILERLQEDGPLDETLLQKMGAVKIDERLILSERSARRSFYLWGKLLIATGKISSSLRKGVLFLYILFLIMIILIGLPVTTILKRLFLPFFKKIIKKQKQYYSWPSGEGF